MRPATDPKVHELPSGEFVITYRGNKIGLVNRTAPHAYHSHPWQHSDGYWPASRKFRTKWEACNHIYAASDKY